MSRARAGLVGTAAILATSPALAANLGHYQPGVANIRDVLVPAPGFYYAQYNGYYSPREFRDRDGDEVGSVTVRGQEVDIDTDIDIYAIVPTLLYVSDWTLLGARVGGYVAQSFGRSRVGATLTANTEFGVQTDAQWGLGDTFVQPIWLGWSIGRFDLAAGYGFYAPTGRYEAGANDNVGLGFWTHQFQLAGAWYLDQQRGTALIGAFTYEINQKQEDVDTTPGDRPSLNYGISQYLPRRAVPGRARRRRLQPVAGDGRLRFRCGRSRRARSGARDRAPDRSDLSAVGGAGELPLAARYYAEARLIGDWFLINLSKAF